MDAQRQLETQMTLHQKTKELLNAAELELNGLRLQQGSGEGRHILSTPSTPIIRGMSSSITENIGATLRLPICSGQQIWPRFPIVVFLIKYLLASIIIMFNDALICLLNCPSNIYYFPTLTFNTVELHLLWIQIDMLSSFFCLNLTIVFLYSSWLSGFSSLDPDREDLQGRLRLAETRAEELTESLRAVTSSMEQYKAMAQSLEESLDKEKQVHIQTE